MLSTINLPVTPIQSNGKAKPTRPLRIALVGNPNSGKTTLFNALTGLNFKVGNYPGVTVEQREGEYTYQNRTFTLIDLPGTYSLSATSDDERIVSNLLFGLAPSLVPADVVVVVVDSSILERHLFLATQVIDLGLPTLVALTMNDEASAKGRGVDADKLSQGLGVPVVEVVATKARGVDDLRQVIARSEFYLPPPLEWLLPANLKAAIASLADTISQQRGFSPGILKQLALQLLLGQADDHLAGQLPGAAKSVAALRTSLDEQIENWREADAAWRYRLIHDVCKRARVKSPGYIPTKSDKVDKVLTHPVWGLVFFVLVMAVVFQSIFTWATPSMEAIRGFFDWLGNAVSSSMPEGPLKGLLVDGIIGGVGGVLVFLPQILLLFLFIVILEDSGYMARAAFLTNRHMRRAGLHGKAFMPMLSGFACAIPAIMAARTISDTKDRLATMLVVPLVSCSARLPVYALVIAAFIPADQVFRNIPGFTFQGLVLWGTYLFSLAAAITAAYILRKTLLKGETQPFLLELPPYRIPYWRTVLTTMWERGRLFLTQAGTIILAANIILWFLLAFPSQSSIRPELQAQMDEAQAELSGEALETRLGELDSLVAAEAMGNSYAGRMGKWMEPALKPLGFDWKIGIGLIGSLAAREVFVSTMAVVYGVGNSDEDNLSLVERIANDFSLLVGLNIILFFVLACQCLATVAVFKREANSWKWALFMFSYMTVAAYLASFVFYQVASRIWPEYA